MRKLLTALLLSFSPLLALAAPASEASIIAFLKVTKAELIVDSVFASMEPAMRQSIEQASAGKPLNDQQKKVLELAPKRLSAMLRAELSWEKMLPLYIAIYRENFDQNEIDALIAFYSSPIGQSFVSKMPIITQRAMVSMQTFMQNVTPKIEAAMREILSEVTTLSH